MYAIVKTGGKQYRVAEGDIIKVEKLSADIGETVTFRDIALLEKEGTAVADPKQLEAVTVEGKVLGLEKAKKITTMKAKRRKGYKKKIGHRQTHTRLQITKITG
ncbi:MAG: 50S ribosomal protein L21 [Candidatus Abyssobacteria bacterium SURF_5]|uniref:Large ribosomal subunit protein bL21 n=1 Tax=Abyssobacteria bacterium (strain SURF_5) TaxID=2093360 RepID=A0A3A4NY99_ABYX5|nr:MAG: 50S ribosomal protein L21 [Candidatus Abyssubacteria bacterium SURF_5]